ncbi:hypothetical protein ElyMa_001501400 [Elysia marginata]|uniref:ZP domain-containing protein n=1 Tax=Elysia marginata TaxID=1093978 RepID=A0AAV4J4A7_9GAST|nr:hypothetical protein ElyMa_001501400 [Elysia marginata]
MILLVKAVFVLVNPKVAIPRLLTIVAITLRSHGPDGGTEERLGMKNTKEIKAKTSMVISFCGEIRERSQKTFCAWQKKSFAPMPITFTVAFHSIVILKPPWQLVECRVHSTLRASQACTQGTVDVLGRVDLTRQTKVPELGGESETAPQ